VKFFRLLPALLLLSIFACSTEDAPTDPGNDPPDDDELVAEADIGEAGGTLGDDSVTITIDPGEFDAEVHLSLFQGDLPQASHEVSSSYRLEGLPYDCRIAVALTAPSAGSEGNYIQVWDEDTPSFFPATLMDGVLHGEIIVLENDRSDEDVIADFLGLTGIVAYDYPDTPNRRFHVKVPANRQVAVNEVLADLVESADALEDAGVSFFGYDEEEEESVDLSVMEVSLHREAVISVHNGSVFIYSSASFNLGDEVELEGFLSIAADGLDAANLANTKMDAQGDLAYELANIALRFDNNDPSRLYWILLAADRWAEIRFGPDGTSPEALDDEMILASLQGLYQGSSPTDVPLVTSFADGMSEFFLWAFSSNRWGLELFAELLFTENVATPENLILAFGDVPTNIWWHDWVETLVDGEIVDGDDLLFVTTAADDWIVNEEEDTESIFSADYEDLSANWFNIRLDHDDFTESSAAHFSLASNELDTADLKIHIYKRLGGTLTHLVSGSDILIEGLQQYRIQGAHLLAAVSNSFYQSPFDMKRGADLLVNIEGEPEGGVFDCVNCEFRLDDIREFYSYVGDDCIQGDHTVVNDYMILLEDGHWNGTTFTVNFDWLISEPFNGRNFGIFVAQLNPEGDEVLSYSLDWTQELYYYNSTDTNHMTFDWINGELDRDEGGAWPETFELSGEVVDPHLSLTHTYTNSINDCVRSSTEVTAQTSTAMNLGFSP
jgi:hypothetical protein